MNWHQQQEEALQKLQRHRNTEVFGLFMEWLYAHWQDSMENLSRPSNSDDELKWMHFQAVIFRTLLTELDERFINEINQP